MERISGHAIDRAHVGEREAIPLRISFYVDGYGAKLSAEALYDIGDRRLEEHLGAQDNLTAAQAKALYDTYYAPPSPRIFAEILSYLLSIAELGIISAVEDRLAAAGTPVFPNALLVNRSNPLVTDEKHGAFNILDALYPAEEHELASGRFLDVSCEGTIYSTRKIDRQAELHKLGQELKRCPPDDVRRMAWIRKNLDSLQDGVFYYRNHDGTVGRPINFDFSESFFDEVSDHIGYYSRLGQSKVHWRQGLTDFGEKGVDCDLIMQVMDDLRDGAVDVFVFMTNDMDFFPLIERLLSEGKHVFLCGLEGRVSYKLIDTVGRHAFFNLLDEAVLENLPSIFMALDKPELRAMALQWAWLAMRRERKRAA
ncbi:MAG TPA: NYN domain-containing protein [Novosphingobium sp.]|nr:NYN domain-containing protein [Novosphingobium sp.]